MCVVLPFLPPANLRTLKQYNDEGIKVSPRDMPPPAQTRFEVTQQTNLSPIQGLDGQLEGTAVLGIESEQNPCFV